MDGGTVQVFLLCVCRSGCGTVEMVGGWFGFLFIFYFAVSSPGGRLSVVGFLFFNIGFPWLYLALYAVSYVMSC